MLTHTLVFVCHMLLLCRCCMHVPANASRRCSGPFAMPLEHATCHGQSRVASSSCPSDTSVACNDNCCKSSCDLKLLAGLQYTTFNVSGANMETSMSDPNTWTQQVMLKDIANTPTESLLSSCWCVCHPNLLYCSPASSFRSQLLLQQLSLQATLVSEGHEELATLDCMYCMFQSCQVGRA